MDRRTFIKKAGVITGGAAVGAAGLAAPAIAQSMPEIEWRLTSSYPRALTTSIGSPRTLRRLGGRRRPTASSGSPCRRPAKSPGRSRRSTRCATARPRWPTPRATTTRPRTRPSPSARRCRSDSTPPAERLDLRRRRHRAAQRTLRGPRRLRPAGRQHRGPDGRLVPQGDQQRRRPQGPAHAHPRPRRGDAGQARRRAAAALRRRCGGEARGRRDRRGRMGRALRRPRPRLPQGAKYYYHPGWWDGCGTVHLFIGLDQWNALPKPYQAIVTAAAAYGQRDDAGALRRVGSGGARRRSSRKGAELRTFPAEVLDACLIAANEVFAEKSAASEHFRAIYETWRQFRGDQVAWFGVTELSFSQLMSTLDAEGKL